MRVEVRDDCESAVDVLSKATRAANFRRRAFAVPAPPPSISPSIEPQEAVSATPPPDGFEMSAVIFHVCSAFGVTRAELLSARRDHAILVPRHTAVMLAKYLTSRSTTAIGAYLGGRDHTTVLYCFQKYDRAARIAISKLNADAPIAAWVDAMREVVTARIAEQVAKQTGRHRPRESA